MLPYLDNGGKIPMYGIMMIVGILAALTVLMLLKAHPDIQRRDRIYGASLALVGGILGAKILSVLTSIRTIIQYKLPLIDVIKNGFVFYGGVLGGAVALFIYCRAYKIPFLKFFDLAAVSLPLAQVFGRIGCLCAGCCFGRPTDSGLGVVYTHPADPNTPVGIPLLPTQLFESGYCLVIFFVLLFLSRKKTTPGFLTGVYVVSYGICRFVNEIFRYDAARGFLLGLSTSQIISALMIIAVLVGATINAVKPYKKSIPK